MLKGCDFNIEMTVVFHFLVLTTGNVLNRREIDYVTKGKWVQLHASKTDTSSAQADGFCSPNFKAANLTPLSLVFHMGKMSLQNVSLLLLLYIQHKSKYKAKYLCESAPVTVNLKLFNLHFQFLAIKSSI